MHKRRCVTVLICMMLMISCLTGCQSKSAAKAQEYKELGITQMESGDYENALASFQKALDLSMGRISAKQVDICYYKAEALYALGDTDGAIAVYDALIAYNEKNWEAYYLRGTLYLEIKETDLALADYAQADELHAKDIELCAHMYENLAAADLAESGQSYLDTVLEAQATEAVEYYCVGKMYYLLGNYESARVNLLEAKSLEYEEAYFLLGCIYLLEENYEDALDALVTYLGFDSSPSAAAALKNLMIVYESTGDFESAYEVAAYFLTLYEDEEVEREAIFLQTRIADDTDTQDDDVQE